MPPRKRKGDGDKAQGLRELRERQYEAKQAASQQQLTPKMHRLVELEATIEAGSEAFVRVGTALAAIRSERLYRERGHDTFEAYCEAQYSIKRARAYQLINATAAVRAMSNTRRGLLDINARQAAELAPLAKTDPVAAQEAWNEASADGKPTAAKVRAAVKARTAAPEPELPADFGQEPTLSPAASAFGAAFEGLVHHPQEGDTGTIALADIFDPDRLHREPEPLSDDDLDAMREREVAAQGEANVEYAEQRATIDAPAWSPERQAIEDIALEMGLPPSVPLASLQRTPSQSGDRFVRELRRGVQDLLSKLTHPEMQTAIAAGLVLDGEERASLVMQVEHLRDYLTKVSEALSEGYTADETHFVDMVVVR